MVDVSEIDGPEKLEEWLVDKPEDWSVWIALRATIRAWPLAWAPFHDEENGGEIVPLMSMLITQISISRPIPVLLSSARIASERCASALASGTADLGLNAVFYAVQASGYDNVESALTAVEAAHDLEEAAWGGEIERWAAIRCDCEALAEHGTEVSIPLWSNVSGPFSARWQNLKRNLPSVTVGRRDETARTPLPEDWSFWIRWYDAALEGRLLNPDMLEEIALIPPETWDEGPSVVNPLIADIEAKYLRLGTWNAERIVENSETHRLRVEPSSVVAPGNLQDVQEKMRGAAEAFDGEGGANGPYGALASEVDMVRRAAGRNDPRPIYLYDTCRRAMRRATRKAQKGDCPEDAPLEDFISQLDEASSDLRTFNADVERVAASRAEKNIAEAGEGARDVLLAGAQKVAEVSEGDLAKDMPEDAFVATDPEASAEARKTALYRLASRLTRVWAGAKKVAKQVGEETDDIAKMSKNTATIILSSGAVLAAINYLIALF